MPSSTELPSQSRSSSFASTSTSYPLRYPTPPALQPHATLPPFASSTNRSTATNANYDLPTLRRMVPALTRQLEALDQQLHAPCSSSSSSSSSSSTYHPERQWWTLTALLSDFQLVAASLSPARASADAAERPLVARLEREVASGCTKAQALLAHLTTSLRVGQGRVRGAGDDEAATSSPSTASSRPHLPKFTSPSFGTPPAAASTPLAPTFRAIVSRGITSRNGTTSVSTLRRELGYDHQDQDDSDDDSDSDYASSAESELTDLDADDARSHTPLAGLKPVPVSTAPRPPTDDHADLDDEEAELDAYDRAASSRRPSSPLRAIAKPYHDDDDDDDHHDPSYPPTAVPPSGSGPAPSQSDTILQSDRATHEALSSELLRMASILKSNSLAFADALERDRMLVEKAGHGLEGNLDLMTRTRGKLGVYSKKARSMGCITLGSIVVVVVSWILMFFVIRLT